MCLTNSKVHIGKHLPHTFFIQNGLEQGNTLLSSLFNFALVYNIKKVPENQVGQKLYGSHQLSVYASVSHPFKSKDQ
jgi:hypothetical protein